MTDFSNRDADGPLEIADYGLLSDCRTSALVGRNGAIDWLCWPRFDSGACFSALLGNRDHGRWLIAPAEPPIRATRTYAGDTMVLETIFETATGTIALIDFMPIKTPSSSVVRIVEGRRGAVRVGMDLTPRFEYGSSLPWVTDLDDGSGLTAVSGPNLIALRSNVDLLKNGDISIAADFMLNEGERVRFVLSYGKSYQAPPGPLDVDKAHEETLAFWREWSQRCQYTGKHRAAVLRSLLTLKALTFVESGGIVAAPTTSLPERLGGNRNWDYRFCWLRDATFTLMAMMGAGYHEEARDWCEWLYRTVAGMPHDIRIVYGVDGVRRLSEWKVEWLPGYQGASPVRIGNAASDQFQLDVWGELMDVFHMAREGGLKLAPVAWSLQCGALEHLEKIWKAKDNGIWEMRGGQQHFTESKMMAWVAYDRAIQDAEKYGLKAPLEHWRALRDEIHRTVCAKGYDPIRGAFMQSFGSFQLDSALLLMPLVGFLPVEDPRVAGTVAAIERELMIDGFVRRYHTHSGADGLPPGEGVFLACNFWLADVYFLQNRDAEAHALLDRLLALCNDLGLLSEEYAPEGNRLVGNFPQAFSHMALVNTALIFDRNQLLQSRMTG